MRQCIGQLDTHEKKDAHRSFSIFPQHTAVGHLAGLLAGPAYNKGRTHYVRLYGNRLLRRDRISDDRVA